ncbi:MAG: hypothetical protein EBV03_07370 [Proteobacteria bacterium]|nr:hypothetical protein [Pseudomonadota bacterium]
MQRMKINASRFFSQCKNFALVCVCIKTYNYNFMPNTSKNYRAPLVQAASLCFFFALAVCMASPVAYGQDVNKSIIIEADEWCPINCANGPKPGIGIEIAKRIFEPLGYSVIYKIVPWTKALSDVQSGKADAVVGANRNDGKGLIFPDYSLFNMSDDFYVRKGNPWRYQGPHTLKDKRLGIISGYGYGDVVTEFLSSGSSSGKVFAASGARALAENVEKLRDGKIDVIVESKPVMEYTLSVLDVSNEIVWAGGVRQLPVYLAFAPGPKATELRVLFDAGVKKLQASRELDAIYAAYGLRR